MNHITRRAALGGLALVPAAALAAPAAASPLAALIADWRGKMAETERHWTRAETLRDRHPLQTERVVYGRAVDYRDGVPIREDLFARSHREIDAICDRMAAVPYPGAAEKAETLRPRLHDELSAIEDANARQRALTGLGAAEQSARVAGKAERAALHRVLAFRPATLADYELRDAFLLELMDERGYDFEFGEVALIVGGEDLARRLDA